MKIGWIFALLVVCQGLSAQTVLRVVEKEIAVGGVKAKVYALEQPDGTVGLRMKKGEEFHVRLENGLDVPTSIHWHGLLLPNGQDGVAFVTQYALYPGLAYDYRFPLVQAGTFFMHSHLGLQEQRLLAAPLILEGERVADEDVVVLLSDFSFKSPSEIYQALRCPKMAMGAMKMEGPDVVEVKYDAFLANFRTLEDPQVFAVKPGTRVRVRFINASSATNFFVELGDLEGEAIAVDGNRIQPLRGRQFELGTAQRIDVVLNVPEAGGAFPLLAKGEDTDMQAGILLTTPGAALPSLKMQTEKKAGILNNGQEKKLHPLDPLTKRSADRKVEVVLGGNMETYAWTLNGQMWPEVTPIVVKKGERVEMSFKNNTKMTHPMHLHGHVFQVLEIDGVEFQGAMRDTVLVMPGSTVTIAFDANHPGVWPLHCHVLYHLEAGMMTVVRYADYIQPLNL